MKFIGGLFLPNLHPSSFLPFIQSLRTSTSFLPFSHILSHILKLTTGSDKSDGDAWSYCPASVYVRGSPSVSAGYL